MSNGQFNYSTPLTRRTLARAEAVNAIFQAIAAGFDLGYSAAQIDALLTALEAEILADYTAAINAAITGGPGAAFASQAQAEAGSDNTTLMSPLRVSQAISALTAAAFAAKLALSGGTMTGPLLTVASAAVAGAGLRLPHGTAPTSPTNGDTWTTTAGLYARINGSTVGPFGQAKTMTLLASSAASGAAVAFTSIDQNYSTLLIMGEAISHNSGSSQTVTFEYSVNNGSGYTSIGANIVTLAAASATGFPAVVVPGYALTAANPMLFLYSAGNTGGVNAISNTLGNRINACRFNLSGGSFDAGNVYLYGMP